MSFYIYTTPDGTHFRHETNPNSVAILDSAMQPLGSSIVTAGDDYDCAVSFQSRRFAIGYWSSADLSTFDLDSGDLQRTIPFKRIGPLAAFDESGTRLLLKSGSQVVLLNVESSVAIQLKGVRALDRLVVCNNQVVVPSRKKDELLRISLQTGEVATVHLPFKATLFDLKQSPCGRRLIAIDRKKCIHCIETTDWSIVWSVAFKKALGADHMGVGQFSGDGRWFGAAVAASGNNYTLVLDAHSGNQIARHESLCYGLPHCGAMVREQSTDKDSFVVKTLDLQTGQPGTANLVDVERQY